MMELCDFKPVAYESPLVACTEVILHDCCVVLLLIVKITSLEKMIEKEKRVGIKLIEGLGLVYRIIDS